MKENTKPINPNWNRVLEAIGAKPKAAPAVPAIKEPAAELSDPIATLPLSKLRPFRDHPGLHSSVVKRSLQGCRFEGL